MLTKKIIMSHPTSNSPVRAAASGMAAAGSLYRLYTTFATFPDSLLHRLGRLTAFSDIRRRSFEPALRPFIRVSPVYELGRIMSSKFGLSNFTTHETGLFSIDKVYRQLDRYVAHSLSKTAARRIAAVFNYEDGAAHTFAAAKKLGITCLYDLPIGYWRTMHRVLEAEARLRPDWAVTLTGLSDSAAKLARKDEELQLADHLFVASTFTASTLQDYPGTLAPVSIIPYGFPAVAAARNYPALKTRPLRILFVGSLSQRKGIANLFEAVQSFGDNVALTLIGQKVVGGCTVLDAALARHQWLPSLPHADILKLMQQQDVLVFPSLFEGFGLVISEAMSQGTPVITTERTAGPDIIRTGDNGWLTEAGNTPALQAAIEQLLLQPRQLQTAGKAAMETARLRPWNIYGQELAAAIETVLANR